VLAAAPQQHHRRNALLLQPSTTPSPAMRWVWARGVWRSSSAGGGASSVDDTVQQQTQRDLATSDPPTGPTSPTKRVKKGVVVSVSATAHVAAIMFFVTWTAVGAFTLVGKIRAIHHQHQHQSYQDAAVLHQMPTIIVSPVQHACCKAAGPIWKALFKSASS
jgi:hypothetical protein